SLSSRFISASSLVHRVLHSFPTRRSSDLLRLVVEEREWVADLVGDAGQFGRGVVGIRVGVVRADGDDVDRSVGVVTAQLHEALRSEEHTSELQSRENLVCRLLLEKKKKYT